MTARAIAFLGICLGALFLLSPESFTVTSVTQELKDFAVAAMSFAAALLALAVLVSTTSASVRGD